MHLLADLVDAFGPLGVGQNSFEAGATAIFKIHDGLPFYNQPARSRDGDHELMTASVSEHRLSLAPPPQALDQASEPRRGPPTCSSQDRLTWEGVQMTDPRIEWASGVSESDTRAQSDADYRRMRALTIDDLGRAAAAAVDLDDPDVIDVAWR